MSTFIIKTLDHGTYVFETNNPKMVVETLSECLAEEASFTAKIGNKRHVFPYQVLKTSMFEIEE